MKYKCLLWDVDGTLLDFTYSQRYAITTCMEEIGITADEQMIQRYAQINDSFWKRLELGEITKEQLLTGRFLTLFEEYGLICPDIESFRKNYQQYLGSVYRYIEDSLSICRRLQSMCRQFIVTNGVTHTQMNKLTMSGFTEIMEEIFISEQIGIPKPQKGFFDACFEKMPDVCRNEVLIIGDSLSSDIKGGIQAGIASCWYNPSGEANHTESIPDYEIRHLDQIFEILKN